MRSVVYTNVIHSLMKYAGVGIAVYFGLSKVGGLQQVQAQLRPAMFSWTNVGLSQILAWFIAGIGAIVSTQYVIQAINTVDSRQKAQVASIGAALLLAPFGGCNGHQIGNAPRFSSPASNPSTRSRPWIADMNGLLAGLVAAGPRGLVVRRHCSHQRLDRDAVLQGFLRPIHGGGRRAAFAAFLFVSPPSYLACFRLR